MPDRRALLVALGVGVGIAAYTTLWWHWPLAVGGGIALVLAGLTLVGTLAVGRDPTIADAAWRAAAPDLQDPPAEPATHAPPHPTRDESERPPGKPGAVVGAEGSDELAQRSQRAPRK